MEKLIVVMGLAGLIGSHKVANAGGITSKIDPTSPFAKEASALGLEPNNTSQYELTCAKLSLPKNATPDQIIEAKYGFNPSRLTPEELTRRLRDLSYTKVQDLYSNLLK